MMQGGSSYDPGTGRFVSEDRYMGSLTNPASQNRYVYAEDNPTTLRDANGRMVQLRPLLLDGWVPRPPSYSTYLFYYYVPSHISDLVTDGLVVTIAALGPPAIVILGGQSHIFTIAGSIVLFDVVTDISQFSSSANVGSIAITLANIGYDVASALLDSLSPLTLIELAVSEGLYTIGTIGVGDLIDMAAALTAATIAAGSFIAQSYFSYESFVSDWDIGG